MTFGIYTRGQTITVMTSDKSDSAKQEDRPEEAGSNCVLVNCLSEAFYGMIITIIAIIIIREAGIIGGLIMFQTLS